MLWLLYFYHWTPSMSKAFEILLGIEAFYIIMYFKYSIYIIIYYKYFEWWVGCWFVAWFIAFKWQPKSYSFISILDLKLGELDSLPLLSRLDWYFGKGFKNSGKVKLWSVEEIFMDTYSLKNLPSSEEKLILCIFVGRQRTLNITKLYCKFAKPLAPDYTVPPS